MFSELHESVIFLESFNLSIEIIHLFLNVIHFSIRVLSTLIIAVLNSQSNNSNMSAMSECVSDVWYVSKTVFFVFQYDL